MVSAAAYSHVVLYPPWCSHSETQELGRRFKRSVEKEFSYVCLCCSFFFLGWLFASSKCNIREKNLHMLILQFELRNSTHTHAHTQEQRRAEHESWGGHSYSPRASRWLGRILFLVVIRAEHETSKQTSKCGAPPRLCVSTRRQVSPELWRSWHIQTKALYFCTVRRSEAPRRSCGPHR